MVSCFLDIKIKVDKYQSMNPFSIIGFESASMICNLTLFLNTSYSPFETTFSPFTQSSIFNMPSSELRSERSVVDRRSSNEKGKNPGISSSLRPLCTHFEIMTDSQSHTDKHPEKAYSALESVPEEISFNIVQVIRSWAEMTNGGSLEEKEIRRR